MADTPPPVPTIIHKGYSHFKAQLSMTLPNELRKANQARRAAVAKLSRGKF